MGVQLYNNTTGVEIYPITDFASVKKNGTGTNLQTTLDGKASTSHTHTSSNRINHFKYFNL